jgi:4-hydroxybenzoate polyprenyltransferase
MSLISEKNALKGIPFNAFFLFLKIITFMTYFQLARYPNLIIIVLTLTLPLFSNQLKINELNFFLLIIFSVCIAAAGYVVNDIFDLEIDRINKPKKVIIGEKITEKQAWQCYFLLNGVAFLIAVGQDFFSQKFQLIFIFFITTFALFAYAKWLKKTFLLGNFIVSALCALTPAMILICWQELTQNASDNFPKHLDFFINFSFLITFFREIIKDIEDIEGDQSQGAKTLPIVAGITASKIVAALILLLLLFQVFILSTGIKVSEFDTSKTLSNYYAFLFIEIPIIALLFLLYKASYKTHYTNLSFFTKILMLFGLFYLIF